MKIVIVIVIVIYALAPLVAWRILRRDVDKPVADPEFDAADDEFVPQKQAKDEAPERRDVA